MTVKELFDFIKGVRPGFAFTDAQLTVWLNEIEGHVQTDIWLLEPAVDETQTGLVEYDSSIDPETGEMVDANHELLVPFPWNKLYRYFLLMSIDLANGEYQRYANSYELFNEAYEEYAGWYAQHVSPANGDAITRGYYISAYQFAARGGYAGTEEEFYEELAHVGEAVESGARAEAAADAAEGSADKAHAWANGGEAGVPSETNNAKFYADQAKAHYGAPLVALTAAEMEEQDRVYVYVGEEEGYTNGDWYYFDGGSWVSGGVYNSTAFETDTTLSYQGLAADAKAVGDNLNHKIGYQRALTTEDDLNTLNQMGSFRWANSGAPINSPISVTGTLLDVKAPSTTAGEIQIIIAYGGRLYARFRTASGWGNWIKYATVTEAELRYLGNTTPEGLKAQETANKLQSSFTPLASIPGFSSLNVGQTYTGVLYKATHYYSRDALFNYNLETIFSMFHNPDSLIYTWEIETDGNTKYTGKGGAYTGAVCSSVASWICGLPIYYTTYDIDRMLDYKEINDISDIEIGDVLICLTKWGDREDHAMVVTNIACDSTGITSVEITEGWGPCSQKDTYSRGSFWNLFDRNKSPRSGDAFRVGRFTNTKLRTIPPIVINTDIVSERGDNTYYEQGEDIYIQSSQDSFQVMSPSGVTSDVNFTALPAKAGTCMRNVGGILNTEVGRWTLYGANGEKSHLSIIKKGTAILDDTASVDSVPITLSGFSANCIPVGFAVVGVMRGQHGAYDPHMDETENEYSAMRITIRDDRNDPRYAGIFEGVEYGSPYTFTVNLSDVNPVGITYPRIAVYVRVFYDTGCGQAWQDTNLYMIP